MRRAGVHHDLVSLQVRKQLTEEQPKGLRSVPAHCPQKDRPHTRTVLSMSPTSEDSLSILGARKGCANIRNVDISLLPSVTQAQHHQRKAKPSLGPFLLSTHQYTQEGPSEPGPGPLCPTGI